MIGLKKPKEQRIFPQLNVGSHVPNTDLLKIEFPNILVAFLRHPGCPFAEKMVKEINDWHVERPDVTVYLVCHGESLMIDQWLKNIDVNKVFKIVYDKNRVLYGRWGLGYSNFNYFMGISSLWGVLKLLFKGIKNRSATGTRWQKAGVFLVNKSKIVWMDIPESAEKIKLPS